jgi:hypothetical protein
MCTHPQVWNLSVAVAMYLTFIVKLSCTTSIINMVSQLTAWTNEEQHAVNRFLWAEGVVGAEIYRRLLAQCGGSVLLQQSVYNWIEMFRSGVAK